jgi:glycosidase
VVIQLLVVLHKTAPPQQWAHSLLQLLHDQSLTLPDGALKMRWVANHDTVRGVFHKKRPREAYGFERARALHALCCLIDGVPMIYQGEEDPALYGGKGESIVDYLAKIIALRKKLPALARGTADYASVRASDGVFACLRTYEGQKAVVLVSFNAKAVKSRVTMSDSQGAAAKWKDQLSGETVDVAGIAMDNHQVRVLVPAR